MKITVSALLLSGIFTATMVPTATATAGDRYVAGGSQGYVPGYAGAPSFRPDRRFERSQMKPDRSSKVMPTHTPYRFRPWTGNRQQTWRAATNQGWRRPVPGNYSVWQPNQPGDAVSSQQRYHFRPLHQADHKPPVVPSRLTYRPANITIPDHYVYRPLNPVKKVRTGSYPANFPVAYAPPAPAYRVRPHTPQRYAPTFANHTRPMARYQPRSSYAYASRYARQPHTGFGFRPTSRAYGPAGYPGSGYSMNRAPRYTARWPARSRFRPSPQFQRPFVYPQGNAYPAMAYTHANQRWGWYGPSYVPPHPNRQVAPEAYGGVANRRIDWYDGQADTEGAWYKLTQQQEWPRVSQNWREKSSHY